MKFSPWKWVAALEWMGQLCPDGSFVNLCFILHSRKEELSEQLHKATCCFLCPTEVVFSPQAFWPKGFEVTM